MRGVRRFFTASIPISLAHAVKIRQFPAVNGRVAPFGVPARLVHRHAICICVARHVDFFHIVGKDLVHMARMAGASRQHERTQQQNPFVHTYIIQKRTGTRPVPFVVCGKNYSIILVTTPAPTVWPPSRIAKRKPSSIATGVISFTSISALSPGIIMSCLKDNSPVTSVVLK